MSNDFVDIKISEFDDKASGASGVGALSKIVLKLSNWPPTEWVDYFNTVWSQHFYMMKRQASVAGDKLQIVCMTSELQCNPPVRTA